MSCSDVTRADLGDPPTESHSLSISSENDARCDCNRRFDDGSVYRPSTMDTTSQVFRPIPLKLSTVVSAHQSLSLAFGGGDVSRSMAVSGCRGSANFNRLLSQWNRSRTKDDVLTGLEATGDAECDKSSHVSLDLRSLLPSADVSTAADSSCNIQPLSGGPLATSLHRSHINVSRGGGVVRPVPLRIVPY